MPIITGRASAAYGAGFAKIATLVELVGSYDSLASITVPSGGVASINFSSIPSGYKHLQIRGLTRSTRANTSSNIHLGFNADTNTSNYFGHMLEGNGAAIASGGKIGSTTSFMSATSGASNTAGIFSGIIIDVLDYASTTKNKTSRNLSGYDANGSGLIYLASGLYINLAPITSIELTDPLGTFAQHTQFSLYGVR